MDSETSYDYVFKIIFLGEAGVGKTSILNRHFKREFEEKVNSTIGVNFYKKIYEKNIKICFQYWDTAGQERYKSLIHAYLVKADVIVFIYDITEKNSFNKIDFWMELVKQCKLILLIF